MNGVSPRQLLQGSAIPAGLLFTIGLVAIALAAARGVRFVNGSLEASGGCVIRVFSAGRDLKPAFLGLKPQHDAIVLGDYVLTRPNSVEGLRAAVFDRRADLIVYRVFTPKELSEDTQALGRVLETTPDGGYAALTVCGRMLPETAGASAAVSECLGRIGASAAPLRGEAASWAYVVARQHDRWIPRGEAYSEAVGVSLTLNLRANDPATFPAVRSLDHARRRSLIPLFENSIAFSDSYIEYQRLACGTSANAICAVPPFGPALQAHPDGLNRTLWRQFRLGNNAQFVTLVSIQEAARGLSDGVIFEVRVNGSTIAAYPYGAGPSDSMGWQTFRADLGEFAGQTVDLELVVAPNGHPSYDWSAWGDPAIIDEELRVAGTAKSEGDGRIMGLLEERNDDARIVVLSHVYPLNGFDKRLYPRYLGWDTSDPTGGQSILARLAVDRDASLRSRFYQHAASLRPARVVWGGDNAYGNSPGEAAAVAALTKVFPRAKHVVLPGNHDPGIAQSGAIRSVGPIEPNSEEVLKGVRLLYLDAVTDNGVPMNALSEGEAAFYGWAHWESHPTPEWIRKTVARLDASFPERSIVVFLHHAPWISESGSANIPHPANSWWTASVHPVLAKLVAEQGKCVTVIAGDAGDNTLCDARAIDGVHYAVCGQPRFDSDVPFGFLLLEWNESDHSPRVTLHACALGSQLRLSKSSGPSMSSDVAMQSLPFAVQDLGAAWELDSGAPVSVK